MIYIAAPFGNYIHRDGISSVMGTFTLHERKGLLLQLIKTLRYSFIDKCWYNRLGLRNPGIHTGFERYRTCLSKPGKPVMSVAAIEPKEWEELYNIIPEDIRLELNISCPNIDHYDDYVKGIERFVNHDPIIKLSPLTELRRVHDFYDMGFRKFHSCNTLPTDKGARSGNILRPRIVAQIAYLKTIDDDNYCIAGGGIESMEDINYYAAASADGYSLGSVCFHPFKFNRLMKQLNDIK